ncbi:TonB-dependent siderophore receptor [Paracoccus alkanivorans]|uniref:TonB-dependent siderophore receptor n=1 Tax=Paracoccus alkanivorans TaxID=2116655 RepID=A0A3M0MPA9_9RHOB|nr:TonB-dependent siderophore receptor [Paracoccus alkanivorans]RMC37550.1 TonB-dependent siderophore receptor [Paracoccus alkanivorans]
MYPSFRTLRLAGVSTIALATAAVAQDDQNVIVLDPIVLTATTDTTAAPEGYVANHAQIATKSDTPLAETQQSLSVVTNQQIRDQGAENLGQALSYTSGVLGQPFGADARFNNPTFRGFSAESAQYVNGLRQFRYFGALSYETYGMQQVEVLRGPSSSLYGAGSPAGIINQIQKRAQSADFGEIGIGYDSNQSAQLFFDVNRTASEALSWRLTGIARDDSTQIEDLTNKRGYLAGAVRWNPGDGTTIDFLASYTKDSPIPPTGVPVALALNPDVDHDYLRELYTGQKNWDDSDRKMWNLGVEVSHELDNGWTLSQGFRYEKLDWEYKGTYARDMVEGNPDVFTRGSSHQIEESDAISLDTRLSGEVVTGQATHQILVGVDVLKYEADESSHFGSAPDLNWRDPDYYGPDPVFTGEPSAGSITFKQVGLYVQDEIAYNNWRGSFGLRYDWVEQTGSQYGNPAEFKDNKLTGRAGLSYVFANGVMPYVSYATSYDPETGLDINEDMLKPTEGRQWEIGVKYQPTAFDGLITASVYDLRQTNVKYAIPDTTPTRYQQIGEVKSRGFELEATAEIADGWDLRAGYAYNKTEQVAKGEATNGNAMVNAPRHLASIWLDRDFGNGWRVGGGLRYIGSRFTDTANTVELGDVTLVDLAASYTRGNIETSLNVSNLTDETYVASCGFSYCSYGEGRTVTAKVSYKW